MRRSLTNIISVVWSAVRLLLLKIIRKNGLYFHLVERISPNVVLEIERGAVLKLGKRVRIHSGGKIKIRHGGKLKIGNNARINYGCMFFCHDSIEIGDGVEFGPHVFVYDHDHDFRHAEGLKANHFKTSPVIIGRNVWIGANTVILRGTIIGDGCVIGAGSVVKGNYPPGSLIVQKRDISVTPVDEV